MDYQKEKEMQHEIRQELAPQIAAALSEQLGETWIHKPSREGYWYTYITGPGGCGIHIGEDRGRFTIAGQWPEAITDTRGTHTFHPYRDRPCITVGFTRGAQAIAKDIARRFLPKYLPLWDQMLQQRFDHIDANKRGQELLARLAEAGGTTHEGHEVRIWQRGKIDEPRAKATVPLYPDKDNPTVELHLENIPISTAEQIMALVGQL